MKLDLTSFEKAINQLEESLRYFHSSNVQQDEGLALHMRAAVIQAFEFTYELSWKTLRRYLEATEPSPDLVGEMNFDELIRTCNEKGLLLSNVANWHNYRKQHSTTSHTYNEDKAEQVFKITPQFLEEVKFVLQKLKERSA